MTTQIKERKPTPSIWPEQVLDNFLRTKNQLEASYEAVPPGDLGQESMNLLIQSFKFSQGNPISQDLLMLYGLSLLKRRYGEQLKIGLAEIKPRVVELGLPTGHKTISEASRPVRFGQIFDRFVDLATYEGSIPPTNEHNANLSLFVRSDSHMVIGITNFMVQSEIEYMKKGRPNRDKDNERYRSLIKDYCFDGKSTNSPEIDILLAQVGEILKGLKGIPDFTEENYFYELIFKRIKPNLIRLETAYEARNLSKSFFP